MKLTYWLTGLFVITAISSLAMSATTTRYLPDQPPSVGEIRHLTVFDDDPDLDRERLEIGIGEEVDCWIDESTWNDPDYEVNEGLHRVYDSLGSVIWMVIGEGEVYPTVGPATTVTALLAATDNAFTVTATVSDSGTMGMDDAIVIDELSSESSK